MWETLESAHVRVIQATVLRLARSFRSRIAIRFDCLCDLLVELLAAATGRTGYLFATIDAYLSRKHLGGIVTIDIDAERVRKAVREWPGREGQVDKAAMDAAQRLSKREPNHPALVSLARLLDSRDLY